MADIRKDDLSPGDREPAEGARGAHRGAEPAPPGDLDESHLGAGGDPVEGQVDEGATGPAPAGR
jgi:hypothetical protein